MLKLTPIRVAAALLPLLSLTAACSDAPPIDPDALAERAALHAREMVHQTGGGVAFTQAEDSGLLTIMEGMAHASDGLAGMAAAIPPSMMSGMMGAMAADAMGVPSLTTTEEDFDDAADDLRTFLRERVLTAANLESKTHDEAVYLLRGDPTCLSLPRASDPPGTVPTLDQKCVDDLTKLEVRVIMRADGDGVRLVVQVGPDCLELVTLVVHSNLLSVELDLAKAHAASQFVSATLGTDSPMGDTQFEALAGALRLALRKDGERRVTLTAAVTKPIHVATKSAAGELGPDINVAASDPILSVAVDGVAQTAKVAVDVGAVDVLADWSSAATPGAAPNRDLHVQVGGITGALTFKEGVDELAGQGLGVGPSSIKVRGESVVDLLLNPNDLNRFDVKITVGADGEPHLEVVPRFDLTLGLRFGGVATDFAADAQPPAWALDEIYGVRLDNGGAASTVRSVAATATFGGGIGVGPGTLTLSSSKAAEPVTVPAGKCLTGVSMPPVDAHPLLGALAAVDCP